MNKLLAPVIGCLLLSGCAAMNPLSMLKPEPSIKVNAQVAKNASQEESLIKLDTGGTQTADTISNDTAYQAQTINQITNELTWWQWVAIILCIGAGLPSWAGYWVAIRTVISYPFKGITKFIKTIKE